jgi:hypothetical protein
MDWLGIPATLPPGRVPAPPPPSLRVPVLVLGTLGLAAAGLLAVGLGVGSSAAAVMGKVGLGVAAALSLGFAGLELLERRVHPGRELGWCPATPGQRFALGFVAQPTRYHGIWLALDLSFPVAARSYRVVTSLHVVASGRVVFAEEVSCEWCIRPDHDDDVGQVSLARHVRQPEPGEAPLASVLEVNRSVELDTAAGPGPAPARTGRFRALSLLCKLPDVLAGEAVEVLGTVQCPDFPTAIRAHAAVALAR